MTQLDLTVKSPDVIPEPTMTQVIIADLKKVPQVVLDMSAGNWDAKEMMVQAIGEALQIVNKYADITYSENVAVPVTEHEGPDIQMTHIAVVEKIDNLAQQYWDEVSP